MRLTRAAEYAVRCILFMTGKPQGTIVRRREIAAAMDIPGPFLGKVALSLQRARIIEILQGSRGGYRLLRTPAEISLLEVVEASIGELYLNDCVLRPESCNRSDYCAVHDVWKRARDRLRETLREADFETLGREGTCPPAPAPESTP